MKRIGLQFLANVIFLVHCVVLLVIFFGWLFPSIWWAYMAILSITLVLDIILGYCILSKWEFDIRKKLNPRLRYRYNFTSFYTRKWFKEELSEKFIEIAGFTFIGASLLINIFFRLI